MTRLQKAVATVRSSIDTLIERGDVTHHGEHREVLETVRMLANDEGWQRRIREAINSGLTAEAGVEQGQQGEGGVAEPAVAVIPVAHSAQPLRQRGRRGRHNTTRRRVNQGLEGQQ